MGCGWEKRARGLPRGVVNETTTHVRGVQTDTSVGPTEPKGTTGPSVVDGVTLTVRDGGGSDPVTLRT